MKDKESQELSSSAFLFTETLTLVSYVPSTTKKKTVLFLSSMHPQPKHGESGKLEIVEFYNSTKSVVDALIRCLRFMNLKIIVLCQRKFTK
ncbi:hypothetical protein Pcinc_003982 [Petrolisthes cinctipes]|uniref:Uncharacterized protein n=1 Tax=Petrolisthes cinctipes TaxID=88211 RepID=A0AAE1GI05_PETCI|nr:hypothetical protein Pcinc_003982 [Petrolisthes cinctipes]